MQTNASRATETSVRTIIRTVTLINYSLRHLVICNYIFIHQTLITSSNTGINYKSEFSSSHLYRLRLLLPITATGLNRTYVKCAMLKRRHFL
ncbi:protein of unknown function [Legionella fallonii LLAP-10]|uniref:Uncharacterized protein n=1 Tax=Legionella fallonii LLAP-10 TaxID=1212491 RepID=A0A098G1Q2_9GAMM|nr:protein of unknown function [Legionella fallonii LLAP-10]